MQHVGRLGARWTGWRGQKFPSHCAFTAAASLFYNKLKNKAITDEEDKICKGAWNDNNMKTFKDFLE